MNNNTLPIATICLIIGGVSGYVLSQSTMHRVPMSSDQTNNTRPSMHRMPDGSMMGDNAGMECDMSHSMTMMVSSEKEFVTEMIPHHQEAVDTAKEVLARGAITPEIRALAQNIITAQEKEITDMNSWYQNWYKTPYQPSGNYKPMMRDLSKLSGSEIDAAFLEDMVMHHMGAIMMAQSVQPFLKHEELKTLTKAIISSQLDEIQQMQRLQAEL